MSFHCSASASDCRSPRARATVHRASLRRPRAVSRTAVASSSVRAVATSLAALRGRVDEGGDVAVDALALHGDLECSEDGAMHAQHRRGGLILLEERVVEMLQVFGLEPVEALSGEVWRDVHTDHGLVALQRPRSYAADRDVREPVIEPALDRVRADRGHGARLPAHFELADLLGNLGPCLG
jgi:hypothetical protein